MFAVVVLHTAAPMLYKIGKVDFSDWMTANIYDSMVRMAVPLFFMLTGVLLLNSKNQPLSVFFKKRFSKVAIPLLAWSLIYILYKKFAWHQDLNVLYEMIKALNHPQYWHLWFMYTILGIYLFLPILKIFIQNSSKTYQIYFVILWIISVSLIPFVNQTAGLSIKSYLPMFSGYIGYLVLGYLLAQITISKKLVYIALFLILLSTLGTIYGTYELSQKAQKLNHFYYSYFSLTTLIQSVSYFIVLKYVGEKVLYSTKISKIITVLSVSSLGIYLVHPIYLKVLTKFGIDIFKGDPLIMIPVSSFATFLVSFATIYIIQSIPVLKRIAP